MAGDAEPPRTERELLELAEDLLAQAAEIKRQWSELARAAGSDLPAESAPAPQDGVDAVDPRRLVAVEMMVSGRDRDEVEAHLRAEFGDDAAERILAEVYGSP